jgi:hypothetical protein
MGAGRGREKLWGEFDKREGGWRRRGHAEITDKYPTPTLTITSHKTPTETATFTNNHFRQAFRAFWYSKERKLCHPCHAHSSSLTLAKGY